MRGRGVGRLGLLSLLAIAFAGQSGCALLARVPFFGREPWRLSQVASEGDAARQASNRLLLDGLAADDSARPAQARILYERALQVDPTNPWAYLALARQGVEGEGPELVLPMLEKAEILAHAEERASPGFEAHLAGLRGSALLALGEYEEALRLLRRARELAPTVWSDGQLDAWELR